RALHGTPLPAADAVRLLIPVAGALEHAHLCGVIHRDLKPANILLQDQAPPTPKLAPVEAARPEGGASPGAVAAARGLVFRSSVVPKITDFGLAKVVNDSGRSTTGAVMGSPSYMPPEQARGKAVGP